VIWRLLTTLPADTAAQAREVAEIYRLRWRIDIDQTWRLAWGDPVSRA
jgi:IS4 transposase